MTESIIIHGIELVLVHQTDNNRKVRHHADLKEVSNVHYGEDGWLTSDQGRIYSMHDRRFLTQAQIEAVYPGTFNA